MPVCMRFRSVLCGLTRCVLLTAALLCAYLGAASAAFYYHQRERNRAQSAIRLPIAPCPTAAARLLVFAPHCDDETLGNAGLMQQTLAAGGAVRVVILTNGDAFPAAVQCATHHLRPTSDDYKAFACRRQQESLAALQSLGVKSSDVSFGGYPDRGLMPLWNDCWTPAHLYTAPTTNCSHAPYPLALHPQAAYCGQTLLADIKAVLCAYRPTLITVTHPAEDHPDHAAAAAFVELALREVQADPKESAWAAHTQLRHYLVHRGDWPAPPAPPNAQLLPPAAMFNLDTQWTTRPLTPAQSDSKARSIALYSSQTALMSRFLDAFIRASELYGELPPARLAVVPDGTIHDGANPADWNSLAPVLLSPLADSVLREWQAGGDIQAVSACRDSANLYLRIDTRQASASQIGFTVTLRAVGPQGESDGHALTLRLNSANILRSDGIRTAVRGRLLTVAIPWTHLTHAGQSVQMLSFNVATDYAGVGIDQTGIRLLDITPLSSRR